jgi:hypothetical protein
MANGLISIFVLPQEIDNLHLTLYNLRRNAEYLPDNVQYSFDITLCLSDELTDWSNSTLPKEYFVDKFSSIVKLCNWTENSKFRIEMGSEILGCVSQRRHTLKYVDDYDFTMWLDNDLFFGDKFLGYIGHAVNALNKENKDYYVITPQVTRQWDTSWDVLVNTKLLSRELNDNLKANVFTLGLQEMGPISLIPIRGFKAAGGWGTVISNKLLKLVGIPESLGHYGLEDTYVLTCANMLQESQKVDAIQVVVDNLLVCENHSGQDTTYLKRMVKGIDKKDYFRQIATQNFNKELERFYNENILQNK